jgi:hypothetical protein
MRTIRRFLELTVLLVALGASTAWAGADEAPAPDTIEPLTAPIAPTAPAGDEPSEPAPLPTDEELAAAGAVVGEVRIRPANIFDLSDPREDRLFFRLANRLHRTTRPRVIEDQLLFDRGDRYDPATVAESERLLRGGRYVSDAEIQPVAWDGRTVDLEVATRDVWTLTGGLGFGREGGANTTRFELQDTNLLGLGKEVKLEYAQEVDRDETIFRYRDPAVLGSRATLTLDLASNSDGSRKALALERPFYSLDSRWATGVRVSDDDRIDPLYILGHVADRFGHRERRLEVLVGRSAGLRDGWAERWTTGFTWEDDTFSPVPAVAGARSLPGTSILPSDRTLAYPWIGFDTVEDRFVEVRDQDQLARVEDFYLGRSLHGRLGFATSALGSSQDAAIFEGQAGLGFRPAPGQTVVLSADLAGRWGSGGPENARLGGRARWYWRQADDWLLVATSEADVAHDLDPEAQLLLGGDSGLRGYPLRYQDGDRRVLLSLEQRLFTGFYPFRLVHVGAAAFFDVGRTWSSTSDVPDPADLGWLRDVGVGLRLSPSRSGLGSVIHLDLAFPLGGDPSIDDVQFLVSTKSSL